MVRFSANNPKHSHSGIFVSYQLETHAYYVVFGNFHRYKEPGHEELLSNIVRDKDKIDTIIKIASSYLR